VFPGEQGGPHVNVFIAMATAFRLAGSTQFRSLQAQIVKNCAVLTETIKDRGLRIPFGGTNTHLTNVDCSSVVGPDGTTLSGDQAARILDIAGIVCNRNTIPGDQSALDPSGIRLGTPWVTQRGLDEADMRLLGGIIADVLQACTPFALEGRKGDARRAKVDFHVLEAAKIKVRTLAEKAGIDFQPGQCGYPHFYYLDDPQDDVFGWAAFDVIGERAAQFLDYALSVDRNALNPGESCPAAIHTPAGQVEATLSEITPEHFQLSMPLDQAGLAAAWLRDLSDGYVAFDEDVLRKLPGPVIVRRAEQTLPGRRLEDESELSPAHGAGKPYFIGAVASPDNPLPEFQWQEGESLLRRTPLYDLHKSLGAKVIPFAGWEMPVWYTSVMEEHLATRQAAGLFDVAHMGVYQVEGHEAAVFLDSVVGNDIGALSVGESCYTHFLTPDGEVIDDTLVYRRRADAYLVVVNASNDDKDWAWLNAVKNGEVCVDRRRPGAKAFGRKAVLRNLRDPQAGSDMRVDIALQGPRSRDILLALGVDAPTRKRILALKRTELCEAVVGGFDLVVSRTGYTGEKMAFELFVHPGRAAELFQTILTVGGYLGVKPIGLGARDSLRTEAGLPLYGHEMGAGSRQRGERDLGVAEGGFGSYVKTYKPWFIGREAYIQREITRSVIVARFRFNEKGVRMAHPGDPVLDRRGRAVGWVTSCAVDSDGLLTGQACLELKSAEPGTPLLIYQSAPDKAGKAPGELKPGDRVALPGLATVITRFP
jgi:glycine hydroxymethyltransferase